MSHRLGQQRFTWWQAQPSKQRSHAYVKFSDPQNGWYQAPLTPLALLFKQELCTSHDTTTPGCLVNAWLKCV